MPNDTIPVEKRAKAYSYPNAKHAEIAYTRDTNLTGSAFSFNPTNIPASNWYLLGLMLRDGSGATNQVTLTFNGVTTTDYDYQTMSGTSLNAESTGQSSIVVGDMEGTRSMAGYLLIVGNNIEGYSSYPGASALQLFNSPTAERLVDGELQSGQNRLSSLTLQTSGDAAGMAWLKAVNLIR